MRLEFPKKVDETRIVGSYGEFGRPVGSGLLRSMPRAQVEAVLGHEISHIAKGDMVTLALLQGALDTFVILLARFVAPWWRSLRTAVPQSATFGFGQPAKHFFEE
jgi:peptidase M48-like protein